MKKQAEILLEKRINELIKSSELDSWNEIIGFRNEKDGLIVDFYDEGDGVVIEELGVLSKGKFTEIEPTKEHYELMEEMINNHRIDSAERAIGDDWDVRESGIYGFGY